MLEASSSSGPHGGGGKISGRPRGRPRGSKNKNPGGSRGRTLNTCGPNFQVTDANLDHVFQLQAPSPSLSLNSVVDDSSIRHQGIPAPLESANSSERHNAGMIQKNQRLNNQHHLRMHQNDQKLHLLPPRLNMGRTLNGGSCPRRLMEYMHDIRHPPCENTIEYWKCFVNHYYAPKAKLRWCLSSYRNFGVVPQSDETLPCGRCNLCGSRSGDGFEATVDVLPSINQIQSDHGIVDEFLFLDMPDERQLSSGIIVLKYEKAVRKTAYKQLSVIRNGQLQIDFTPDLKILTWEFCPQRHEEFFNRGSITSQVDQLLLISKMYEASVTESGSSGFSDKELEANCNMFLAVSQQLDSNLEPEALNYWGFSKTFVRHLQMSQVLSSMKDLMGINLEHKMRALESLYSYPQQAAAKSQTQQMQVEQNDPNRTVAIQPGMRTSFNFNNNPQNHTDPNRIHPSMVLASNSVNNNNNVPSCPLSDNEQCTNEEVQKVIQMLMQELRNNKEALQQQVGTPPSVNGNCYLEVNL